MTLDELYSYYDFNWSKMSRELKFGTTTLANWRKAGTIPLCSQRLIEKRTNGLFKAGEEHAKSYKR